MCISIILLAFKNNASKVTRVYHSHCLEPVYSCRLILGRNRRKREKPSSYPSSTPLPQQPLPGAHLSNPIQNPRARITSCPTREVAISALRDIVLLFKNKNYRNFVVCVICRDMKNIYDVMFK